LTVLGKRGDGLGKRGDDLGKRGDDLGKRACGEEVGGDNGESELFRVVSHARVSICGFYKMKFKKCILG
jgi:hypothetical protein